MIGLDALHKLITRTQQRVQSLVTRAVLTRVDDSKKIQRVQIQLLADEEEDDVEHFQPSGWSFVPESGAECLAFAVGGDRAHTVVLGVNDGSKRPKGTAPGTGGCYQKGEWRIYVDSSGVVHVGAKSGAQPVALADDVKEQFDKIRKQIDQLSNVFQTFASTHQHQVATAGSPAAQTGMAFPATPPPQPLTPLGPATPVAAKKAKAT